MEKMWPKVYQKTAHINSAVYKNKQNRGKILNDRFNAQRMFSDNARFTLRA
jgi:hypothetical protein